MLVEGPGSHSVSFQNTQFASVLFKKAVTFFDDKIKKIWGGYTHGIWKFPGRGLNQYHSSDNAESLTLGAIQELLNYKINT